MTNRLELVRAALKDCEVLKQKNGPPEPFEYVIVQLRYLEGVLEGKESDRSRLKDINVGLIAFREFDTRFPEFADRLFEISKMVDAMKYEP